MFADLPPEILQQIIEHNLAGDLQSLKLCSFVCWQWRHAALPALMSKVVVSHRRRVSADDVRTSAPFLSRYLRHLVFSTASCFLKGQLKVQEANHLLYALLAALPYFTRISRMSITGDVMFNVLASHPEVKLSNISHFTVYRTGEVFPIKIIPTFTHLRVLHFIGVSLDFNDISAELNCYSSAAQHPVPVLEELALQLAPGPFAIFVQWACGTKILDFSQLKTLKISMSDGEGEKSWFRNRLVPLVGAHLQILDFHFYNGPTVLSNDMGRNSELTQSFPSLTTLRIHLRAQVHYGVCLVDMSHRRWVPRCLAEFIPNKPLLRVIEVLPWDLDILLKAKGSDDPEEMAELERFWAEADKSLSGCGRLERFTIHCPLDERTKPLDTWSPEQLHSLLPISMSKGFVHFEQNTDLWPGFDVEEVCSPSS